MLAYYPIPYYPPTLPPYLTAKDTTMNTTDNTLNAIIDRTLSIIDNGLDRNVGDMTLIKALELVGVMMDIRERQLVYTEHCIRLSKPVRSCTKACVKKPKRNKTDGL